MPRVVFIDLAKALCIVLVVVGHYDPAGEPLWWAKTREFIYLFHMPLFLFASGYVYRLTLRAGESYGAFLRKKLRRLMLPYLVVSCLIITLKLLSSGGLYVENPVTPVSYLRMLAYPEAGYFLWFVWSLMETFLLVRIFSRAKSGEAWFFLFSLLLYFLPVEFTRMFCLTQTKGYMVYFAAGALACRCFSGAGGESPLVPGCRRVTGNPWGVRLFLFAATLSFGAAAGLRLWGTPAWEAGSFASLGAALGLGLLGTAWICLLCLWIRQEAGGRAIRPLLSLAAASYMIYLFHTTFMGGVKSFWHKFPFLSGWGDTGFAVEAAVAVAAGVVLPLWLQRYVLSRSRVTRFLFGLK